VPQALCRTGKIISWRCFPSLANERFDVERHNVPNLIGLGERLKKSHRENGRPTVVSGVMPLFTLAAALVFALFLGAPAANAEDALPADPGQVIIVPPPVESPPVDPTPSDPGTAPSDAATPPPSNDLPPPAVTDPPAEPAPAVPPADATAPSVTVTPPIAGNIAPIIPQPARVNPVQPVPSPEVVQPSEEPSAASDTPTPTPAPSTTPSTTAPAAVSVPTTAPVQAGTKIQAAVVAATGSPFAIQLLTVLALLGAGFVYFRALGSKGTRGSARTRN
jgi:hypothetical protein